MGAKHRLILAAGGVFVLLALTMTLLHAAAFLSYVVATFLQVVWLRAGARGMATLGGAFTLAMLGLAGALALWGVIALFAGGPGDTGHSAAARFFVALFVNAAVVEPAVLAGVLWFRSIRPAGGGGAGDANNGWGSSASPGAWDPASAAAQQQAAPHGGAAEGGYKSPAPTTASADDAAQIANI